MPRHRPQGAAAGRRLRRQHARLVKVSEGSTTIAEYSYDALFRRVSKVVDGTTRRFYYSDQWQILEEYLGSAGNPQIRYWHGLRDINDIARRQRYSTGTTFQDDLYALRETMNVVALISAAGTVPQRMAYDAFGNVRFLTSTFAAATNAAGWNFLFHGHYCDEETGLYQMRFRYYHPNLGVWLSRDPIGEEGGVNLVLFVNNNSHTFIDKLGMQYGPWDDRLKDDPNYPGPHNGYEPGGSVQNQGDGSKSSVDVEVLGHQLLTAGCYVSSVPEYFTDPFNRKSGPDLILSITDLLDPTHLESYFMDAIANGCKKACSSASGWLYVTNPRDNLDFFAQAKWGIGRVDATSTITFEVTKTSGKCRKCNFEIETKLLNDRFNFEFKSDRPTVANIAVFCGHTAQMALGMREFDVKFTGSIKASGSRKCEK